MATPVAGEPLQNSDHHLIHPDDNFTISQLIRSKHSDPISPPPPSPLTSSLGKRKKSKPVRYGNFTSDKKNSPSVRDAAAQDSSTKSPSSQKGSSATKHANSKSKSPPAMTKAGEVQLSLGTEHPSCIKMVKGLTDTAYWMGFPLWFGKLFLPKVDSEMVIEDEYGEIHHVKYNAEKSGMSAGWKKFAAGHNLLDGDVLVFHLVEPYKFKVYIVRANDLKKADETIARLNLEARTAQTTTETDTPSPTTKKTKHEKPLSLTIVRKKNKPSTQVISPNMEQSGNNSEEIGSEVLEGSRPSKPDLSFQELEAFKDFHIMVKGVCIDSELPDDVRMNYFKLCMDRKEFLHDCLPDNFYHKLVAGMIGETVNIANDIKNCKLTTTKEEFDSWDNSLKSFSLLGMKVGFLRDRISTLSRLAFESENRLDIEMYMEAKEEEKRVDDEIKRLSEELKKLKDSSRKVKGIVDVLKQKTGRHEARFQEAINAPW
ncbi:putative transcription factor B3-Domain family [Helianthus annuus]|nr:putative transcription factor B3-Domain family [Helianthus annuus]